jgi:hypothetical protein
MICVECMGDKPQEEIRATFINMDEQVPAFCVCEECACNPPMFDSLKSVN